MTIGQQARMLLHAFKKNQEDHQKQLEDQARPQCTRIAQQHSKDIEPLIIDAAKQGNHYIMYNQLIHPGSINGVVGYAEMHLKVIVEQLRTFLEDCEVELDRGNRLRISWKD